MYMYIYIYSPRRGKMCCTFLRPPDPIDPCVIAHHS